jgi:DNA-binding beta-propeller fold protein YncE
MNPLSFPYYPRPTSRWLRFDFEFPVTACVARTAGLLLSILAPMVALQAQSTYLTPYTFTTVAGSAFDSYGSADGTGAAAQFSYPYSVAVDTGGNVYVADYDNCTIRKITPSGVVTTLAGSAGTSGFADGSGSGARFDGPSGVAVDSSGNVYVADSGNNTIRKITPGGVVTTLAGRAGVIGFTDGTGSAAAFSTPWGVAVDGPGNVYVADSDNNAIRKITPAGLVSTFTKAGSVSLPQGVAVDAGGYVYVASTALSTILKFSPTGGTLASHFVSGTGLAVDGQGNVYVANTYANFISKISTTGVVSTFAGLGGTGGTYYGTGTTVGFNQPSGVAVDPSGNVYVADSGNDVIRKVTPAGVVTTLAGTPDSAGLANSTGSNARFNYPAGIVGDGSGNFYVADSINGLIRKVTPGGMVTTFVGGLSEPTGVTVDAAGNLYVAVAGLNQIYKITPGGATSTLAGNSFAGSNDGTGSSASFNYPTGVTVDGSGNVYVADSGNNTIRKITSGGVVTTLAGKPGLIGSADGTGAAAQFNYPLGIGIDGAGNLYVADNFNQTIRKITPAGLVSTYAGSAGNAGSIDGTAFAARFSSPAAVAVDAAGNVFVSDSLNYTIRKISPAGAVTTLAGSAGNPGAANGTGSSARFYDPFGITVDAAGNIYVADASNNTIRRGEAVIGDFNGDGKPDLIFQNTVTGDSLLWLMNGTAFSSSFDLGTVPTQWQIAGAGDFNGDGKPDLVFQNTSTGDRMFWLMNGTTYASGVDLGVVPTQWQIAAIGDFNGDGKPDLVFQNSSTGDRYIWLMNGTTYSGTSIFLGNLATQWQIVGAGDFNGDGKPDLVFENTVTGDRYVWIMNGTSYSYSIYLGNVALQWHIAGIVDLNGDGNPDLVWENTTTGDRYAWLMNGPNQTGTVFLGNVSYPTWDIRN